MKKTMQFFGAVALTVAVSGAQAIPLSDLLAGQTITAGDKLFDQWDVLFEDSSDFRTIDYSAIEISSLDDGGLDPGPGININLGGQMDVEGDGLFAYVDLTIGFRVSTLGDLLIKDNSLDFGIPASVLTWNDDDLNDLGIAVVEEVFDASGLLLADKYIELSVLDGEITEDYPDSAEFAPQSEIFVVKNILTWSVDEGDTVRLGGIEQRFSQTAAVPVPAPLALFALGLLGIGWSRRYS